MDTNRLGVYAHIPYCLSKCPYCDFNSIAPASVPEKRYVEAVLKEFEAVTLRDGIDRQRELASIYFGGGTPSVFSPESIGRIIGAVSGLFGGDRMREITLEANPDSVDEKKLKGFLKAGVNRLSLGVQSLDGELLKTLGRRHDAKKALWAVGLARKAGFDNIGVDLMFGLPGQSLMAWKETLSAVVALRPRHISLYGLTIEDATVFGGLFKRGLLKTPGEEIEIEMYQAAVEALSDAGYEHYEISNFAMPGFESVHNSGYWQGVDYIGLGAGAHSYLSAPGWGRRWWNAANPAKYMALIEHRGDAIDGFEALKMEDASAESLLLGLRMLTKGIVRSEFKQRFDVMPEEIFKRLDEFAASGFLKKTPEAITLTPKGVLISNELFSNMLA